MVQFEKDAVVLAKFRSYPPWPCRVLDIIKAKNNKISYVVFCYGSHEIVTTTASQLSNFVSISKEAKKKNELGVANAFAELADFPHKHLEISGSSLPDTSVNSVNSVLSDLDTLKSSIRNDIEKEVCKKVGMSNSADMVNSIVSQIHDSILVQYSAKFDEIENKLRALQNANLALENRVEQLEARLDDIEQEKRLNQLVFHGVDHSGGLPISECVLNVITDKMQISDFSSTAIVSVFKFRANYTDSDTIVNAKKRPLPVLVTFKSAEIARKVFACKSKLARSGIFVTEYLTSKKKQILDLAKSKLGNRNVWSNNGTIFGKNSVGEIRKIRAMAEVVRLPNLTI